MTKASVRSRAENAFRGVLPLNPERLPKVRVPVDAVCCGCSHVSVKNPLVRDPRQIGSFTHACDSCGSVQWHNTVSRLDGVADSVVFVREAVLELHDASADPDTEPDTDRLSRGLRAVQNSGEVA